MIELGIYGGTFSPIHNGHIYAAERFYDALSLDRLLVIPTYLPPHKEADTGCTPEQRLAMTSLAFEENPRCIEVSDYEIQQKGKSYTYLTLQHFSAPDTRLTFLCGTDMFLTFDEWKKPEIIFSLSRVALIRREDTDSETEEAIAAMKEHYRRDYSADIVEILSKPIEISSTQIREQIRNGGNISGFVPQKICDYIAAHRLYKENAAGGHDEQRNYSQ